VCGGLMGSQFDTSAQEDEYNAWLRAEIAARLANPGPLIPHDEVMADLDRMIDEAELAANRVV